MSRYFISGICGFIGINVALEAKRRGHEVYGIDNFSRQGSEENFKILNNHKITVHRRDIIHDWFNSFVGWDIPDCIIHLAAQTTVVNSFTDPYTDFNTNVLGTVNMLDYAKENGASFVFASTNKVYNHVPEGELINESYATSAFSGHTPYGVSKLCGDLYTQEYYHSFGVPTVVNRMSCIYGLYQHGMEEQGWLSHFMQSILADKPITIYGDGKQVRDVLWGGDCARLYVDQAEQMDKCKGQVFNIGGGQENKINLLDAIKLIEEITSKKATLNFTDWRPNDQKWYVSDIGKITSTIGWKPEVTIEQGLKMMYDAIK